MSRKTASQENQDSEPKKESKVKKAVKSIFSFGKSNPFEISGVDEIYKINPVAFVDSLDHWIARQKSDTIFAKDFLIEVIDIDTGKINQEASERLSWLSKKNDYLSAFKIMVENQSYGGNGPLLLDLNKFGLPILFNPTNAIVTTDPYSDKETIWGQVTFYITQGAQTFIKVVTFYDNKKMDVKITDSQGVDSISTFNKKFNQSNEKTKKNNFDFIPVFNFPNQATKSGRGKPDSWLTTEEDNLIMTFVARDGWEGTWNKTIFYNAEPFITQAGNETDEEKTANFGKKIIKGFANFKQQAFKSGGGVQQSSNPFNVYSPTLQLEPVHKELDKWIGQKFDKSGLKGPQNEKGIVQKSIFEVMQARSFELTWLASKINLLQNQMEEIYRRIITLDSRNFTYPKNVEVRIVLKPFIIQSDKERYDNLIKLEADGILSKADIAGDILNLTSTAAASKLINNVKVNSKITDEQLKVTDNIAEKAAIINETLETPKEDNVPKE